MLNADQIKVRLIDHLVRDPQVKLIASEVAFYHGHRKADLIQMNNNAITAFEIKSDKDRLLNLAEQLNDYNNTFSYCYLVTTEKHLNKARKLSPEKVGLILVTSATLQVLRKPKENKRLCKHSLTLGLSLSQLRQMTDDTHDREVFSVRKKIEKNATLGYLKEIFCRSLIEKYYNQYKNFLSDRGETTTLSDLYYLRGVH